jgi:hypothetical protein
MSAMLFFFGFVIAGIFGINSLASFEIALSERIGAEASLSLLCAGASTISVLLYYQASRMMDRYPGRIAGLVGGVVAAGTFCAAAGTGYLGVNLGFSVILALLLPSLVALVWPLLTPKAQND